MTQEAQETVPDGNPQDDGGNKAFFGPPALSGMECACKRLAMFGVGDPIVRLPYEISILWCSRCRVHLLVLSEEGQAVYCEPMRAPQHVLADIGLMEIALSTEPRYLKFIAEVRPEVEALFRKLTSAKPAKPPSKDWD